MASPRTLQLQAVEPSDPRRNVSIRVTLEREDGAQLTFERHPDVRPEGRLYQVTGRGLRRVRDFELIQLVNRVLAERGK